MCIKVNTHFCVYYNQLCKDRSIHQKVGIQRASFVRFPVINGLAVYQFQCTLLGCTHSVKQQNVLMDRSIQKKKLS